MTEAGFDVSNLTDDQLIDDQHIVLFPNTVLNIFAFGCWLFRTRPHPTDPDYTTWDLWYFHRVPDAMDLPANVENVVVPEGDSVGAVMNQDLRNTPYQQQGMKTGVFPGFIMSDYEGRIAHMHDVLDRYLET